MSPARPVDVAVGVVVRDDGAVLLGQRPTGKPYAGWWEFPGGKLEAGESVHAALVRELDEELGLRVRASCPWVVRRFVYPHATVLLHFRRVFDFEGAPESREGQAFAWLRPGAIDVAPLLPATVPVIAWLGLPAECLRSCAAAIGPEAFVMAIGARLRAGWRGLLLLDEPGLPPDRFEALFYRVVEVCRRFPVRLVVGSRHRASYCRAAGGVLLAAEDLSRFATRPPLPLVMACARDQADVERASGLGVDCVLVEADPSPEARGVPDAPSRADRFGAIVSATGVPAYADASWQLSAALALASGAHGVVAPHALPEN
ncbi:MAG: 8-oxo-dGTP diphosphatase [Pseudomonadota bacterium]|jgi:8-oxo-dGTP diphosphatase